MSVTVTSRPTVARLVGDHGWIVGEEPFEPEQIGADAILAEFAAVRDQESALALARRLGYLGLPRSSAQLPPGLAAQGVPEVGWLLDLTTGEAVPVTAEPIDLWLDLADLARVTVAMTKTVWTDSTRDRMLLEGFVRNASELPGLHPDWPLLVGAARRVLLRRITDLSPGHFSANGPLTLQGRVLEVFATVVDRWAAGIGPKVAQCQMCGAYFPFQRTTRKTCSDRCRQRLNRARPALTNP